MLNIIAIMGRIVNDVELRKTPNGVSTTTFTIACDRNFVKSGEERVSDFIDIVAWRGTAEFVAKYFAKGELIAINGSLQTRSYEDKNGNKRKVYEIIADNVSFAGSKGSKETKASENKTPAYASGAPDDFAVIDDSESLPF